MNQSAPVTTTAIVKEGELLIQFRKVRSYIYGPRPRKHYRAVMSFAARRRNGRKVVVITQKSVVASKSCKRKEYESMIDLVGKLVANKLKCEWRGIKALLGT